MQSMPKLSVYAAGGIVALAAALGVYFGVSRSLSSPLALGDDAGAIVPAVTPVASAKPILTPVPTLDEATVRRMAREEAQALIAKPAPRKAASEDDQDDSAPDPGQLTPVAPPASVSPAKPTPSAPQG